jgi:hypothetical protein
MQVYAASSIKYLAYWSFDIYGKVNDGHRLLTGFYCTILASNSCFKCALDFRLSYLNPPQSIAYPKSGANRKIAESISNVPVVKNKIQSDQLKSIKKRQIIITPAETRVITFIFMTMTDPLLSF